LYQAVSSSITRPQAITDIVESVALEQTALSHILNAEGEKIQKALEFCTTVDITRESHLNVYDFVWNGVILYWGLNEQGIAFAVFEITDSSIPLSVPAYCFDVNTFIQIGDHYTQEILQQRPDISEENANRIRNILFNSFPYISVADVQTRSGIPTLTQAEAVTATQLAIWKLTNNFSLVHSNANVMALYNWYLALPPLGIIINPAEIKLTAGSSFPENTCDVEFSFYTDGTNLDSSPVELAYEFSKDLVAEYGAIISTATIGNVTTVTVRDLPLGANFTIFINGSQTLPNDAYRYLDAQDLVGLFLGTNLMFAQADYVCRGNCSQNVLAVNKSVKGMVKSITNLEMILFGKLDLFEDCLCEEPDDPQP